MPFTLCFHSFVVCLVSVVSAIDKNNNTCSKYYEYGELSIRPPASCFVPSKPKSAAAFIINAMVDGLFIVNPHRGSL